MGLFLNRKASPENMKKQRGALNGNLKNCSLDSKKKVRHHSSLDLSYLLQEVEGSCLVFFQIVPSVQKPPPPPPSAALSPGHSLHPAQGESSQCSDLSGYKRPLSPLSPSQRVPAVRGSDLPLLPHSFLPSDPGQWNIEDVYEFISSLPGGGSSESKCLTSKCFCLSCKVTAGVLQVVWRSLRSFALRRSTVRL